MALPSVFAPDIEDPWSAGCQTMAFSAFPGSDADPVPEGRPARSSLIRVIWLDNQFDYYGSFYTLFAMTAAVLLAVILLAVCVAVGVGSLGKNRRLAEDIAVIFPTKSGQIPGHAPD